MEVGSVTVPATLAVVVGEGRFVIATGDLDIDVTATSRPVGGAQIALTPQSGSILASLARALRGFADELDAQAALGVEPSKNPGTPS